ncbi:MAG: hypothetical protein J5856_02510 [Lachnospiraceae bacterium]|nr:hypothetical protein [Lachnospiraceae bacterium]
MNKVKFLFLASVLSLTAMFCACDKNETGSPKIKYIVDGKEQESAPDKNFYKAVSIESNSKEASIVWDVATWSLEASNTTGRETVNVYFEYQTKPVTVDGIGFDSLQDAFNYIGSGSKRIYLTKDVTGGGNTAAGADIKIELGGFTIDGAGEDTIINNGTMKIYGAGTITNTVDGEYSKSIVNYGDLSLYGVTVTNETDSVAIWNSENGSSVLTIENSDISHSKSGVMTVVNSGTMEIVSGSISGVGDSFHPVLYNNRGSSVLTLTGGSVTNNADGYAIYNESGVINLGGTTYNNSYNMPSAE